MKKYLSLIVLVVALCLAMTACGNSNTNDSNTTSSPDPDVSTTIDTTDDDSSQMPIIIDSSETEDDENSNIETESEDTDETIDTPAPIIDVTADYKPVHSDATASVDSSLSRNDITKINNLVLTNITKESGSKTAQIIDVSATDNYNVIVEAVYTIKQNDVTFYKIVKYDLKRNADDWSITETYNKASFDGSYYEVVVKNGVLSIAVDEGISDNNYASGNN